MLPAVLALLLAPVAFAAKSPPPAAELHVSTEPPGAALTINGAPRGVTPVVLNDLPPGDHLAVLTKLGFAELRRTVTVTAGARQAFDVKLRPESGLVLVTTVPEGARVAVNGADRGAAPLLLTDLPFGRHRLHLEAPDCLPKDVELTIEDRTPIRRTIQLQSSLAAIDLITTPPGATVTLDGGARGTTPLRLDRLQPGAHTLRITLAGHVTHEQAFDLVSGHDAPLNIVLTPIPARIQVSSLPAGARIYVDNQFRGVAPVTIAGLAPGPYRLRAELAGYATIGRTVTVALAADVSEEFRLDSNSGTLELITEPAGVSVFVDGEQVGVTSYGTNETDRVSDPLAIAPLVQGTHTLQLVRKGYFPVEKQISITKDVTATLHETLKRRFIPDYEVVTAAGVDQGVLDQIDADGNVRLEVRPGVIKTIRAAEIKAGRPLQQQSLPELAPPAPEASSPAADPDR